MGSFLFVQVSLVGFFAFAALYHFVLWWFSRREFLFLVFAADSALRAGFSASLVLLFTADSTAAAHHALGWRMSFGLLMSVTWLWTVSLLSGVRARWFLVPASACSLVAVFTHLFVVPLQQDVLRIDRYLPLWGRETVSQPVLDPAGWWFGLIGVLLLAVQLYGSVCGLRVWRRDRVLGGILLSLALMNVVLYTVALLREFGVLVVPYAGHFPNVLTVCAVSILVARAHRKTRDALVASEARVQAIIRATPECVKLVSADGTLLNMNEAGLKMLEAKSEREALGHCVYDAIAPEFRAAFVALNERVCRGEPGELRFDIVGLGGTRRHVETSAVPLPTADGRFDHLAVTRDVTERRRAEAELQESQQRLSAMVANSPGVAIQWYDRDGRVMLWNPASEVMFGFSSAEAVGRTLDELIYTPEEYRLFLDTLAEIARTGQPNPPTEYTFRRRDGSSGVCLSTLFRIPGPAASHWFVCMDVDISERKRAEQALRESEAKLARMSVTIPQALYLFDVRNKRTVYTNGGVWRGLGYSDAEVAAIGLNFLPVLLHPDDLTRLAALLGRWETARDGEVLETEYRLRPAAGEWRWFVGRDTVYERDADGRVAIIIGTAQDVTDRKREEEQRRVLSERLAQSQKMEAVGRLAGGIAHDFNNLLTVINGYCDLLRTTGATAEQGTMLKGIADAGERAAALTRQLLIFSRQQVSERRVFDLNAVVRDAEQLLRRLIGEDIRLVSVPSREPLLVESDPVQVGQVVLNLAANARDAMPTGGQLTIETVCRELDESAVAAIPGAMPGRYALLAVIDTGVGMSAEVQTRIFEPFFTTKAVGRGTGIGLATVHAIVAECGGFIGVSSEPGKGSTFSVYLPVTAAEVLAAPAAPADEIPHGDETVLLVEDDDSVRSVARLTLRRFGYTVVEAADGAEALRVCGERGETLDLVVTDVVMPEIGGRELAERLAAIRPGLPVLFLSGYTADAVIRHGVLQAEVAFLQKPFTPAALARRVREVLDARLGD